MGLSRDRCICLGKVEYSETSQILVIFSRGHGLLRVIARGAHRTTKAGASKFGGGIDLLDVADGVFTDRPEQDLATLTEWTLREGHLPIRNRLRPLWLAMSAAELVRLLIEERDPHPRLFDRLEAALGGMAAGQVEESFLAFELHLLRETGYLPHLSSCISCDAVLRGREPASFSLERGGVLCPSCGQSFPARMPLDRRLLDMLVYLLKLIDSDSAARLPRLTRHQTDALNRILLGHIQHTLGRRLKLARHVLPAMA